MALAAAPLLGALEVTPSDLILGLYSPGSAALPGWDSFTGDWLQGWPPSCLPVAALTGAALPVLFGVLIRGERPPAVTWLGVFLALPAIILLSTEKEEHRHHVLRSLRIGILAGIAFSGFFILIAQTNKASGMWPLVAARCVTVPLFFTLTLVEGNSRQTEKGQPAHSCDRRHPGYERQCALSSFHPFGNHGDGGDTDLPLSGSHCNPAADIYKGETQCCQDHGTDPGYCRGCIDRYRWLITSLKRRLP